MGILLDFVCLFRHNLISIYSIFSFYMFFSSDNSLYLFLACPCNLFLLFSYYCFACSTLLIIGTYFFHIYTKRKIIIIYVFRFNQNFSLCLWHHPCSLPKMNFLIVSFNRNNSNIIKYHSLLHQMTAIEDTRFRFKSFI